MLHLDGVDAADVTPARAKLQRLDGVFDALHERTKSFRAAHPGKARDGLVNFSFPADTPASIVKSTVITAGYAGYPNANLVVAPASDGGASQVIAVDSLIPRPGGPVPTPAGQIINVMMTAKDPIVLIISNDDKIIHDEAFSLAELADATDRTWKKYGQHVDADDRHTDYAVIHVRNDVPYSRLVQVLSAIETPHRTIHGDSISALTLALPPED